jgi:cation diffusion facilitator CzcD-associated flavoprotein CzcO
MSYAVRDEYIYKIRRLRVVCIGAGLTGIAAVHKLQTKHSDLEINFAIYEKNHDVGGTWLENRYPGCACDVPAHSVRHLITWLTNKYTYSWEGNPEWSRYYAGGREIWTYYKKLADDWRVDRVTRFNSRLLTATWDSKLCRYDLEIEDVKTGEKLKDYAEVLINATGWLKCFPASS